MAKKKKPKPVSSGASPVASIDSSVPSASSSATVPVSPDPAAASSPALEEGEIFPFFAPIHHLATAENFQDQNSSPLADLQEKGLEVFENPNAKTAATEPTVLVNPITEAAATESTVLVNTHPEKSLQSDKLQSPPVAPIASNQACESSQLQAQPTTVFKGQAKQQGKEPIASQYPIVPNPAASRYKNNPGPRANGPAPSSHSKKGNSIWIRADPSALEDNGKRQASRSIPLHSAVGFRGPLL
ncbi:hypothetical protein DY000_02057327 [Brassica cretica]|uniref:Ataxin-2 C-terminal domain-containing protein n=1 Tax=Brassica cretica TaxID=69181 RepID=A0ABQ7AMH2_BRACR|nr:hypothetical protein DY000_02057327 [Brassica cretica]